MSENRRSVAFTVGLVAAARYKQILEARRAELAQVLHQRDAIAIETSADSLDKAQQAAEHAVLRQDGRAVPQARAEHVDHPGGIEELHGLRRHAGS